MGRNLEITDKLQTYIDNFSQSLHPIQQEIISYNNTLGDIKRMQIDPIAMSLSSFNYKNI